MPPPLGEQVTIYIEMLCATTAREAICTCFEAATCVETLRVPNYSSYNVFVQQMRRTAESHFALHQV